MDMQAELAERRATFAERAPADVQALMAEAEAALVADGLGGNAPSAGDTAPDFTLPDQLGRAVRLADLLARGPAVVVFYRGHWCPYCNIALRHWQQALPTLEAAGIGLVAISPQLADASLTTAEKNGLGFRVLSDAGSTVATAYCVAFALEPRLAALYERLGHPLPDFNGAGEWRLPLPATFAIGADGRVRGAHVEVDYRTRMAPDAAIALLRDGRS